MPETPAGSVFARAGRPNLFVKFKDPAGRWVMRATKFRRGQEADALAELERLRTPVRTVSGWADGWLASRSGLADVANDRQRYSDHIKPTIGDLVLDEVRPSHLVSIVETLRNAGAAPRTIRNVYSVARAMFRDAVIADRCKASPCVLTHRQLGKVKDADLGWRQEAVFSRDELETLVGDPRLPLIRRVLWGLLGIAGLRDGEACALRWGRLHGTKPLARIVVTASNGKDTTKTETERWMPVHPVLRELLNEWKTGWAGQVGRPYADDDLVLPAPKATNRGPRKLAGSMLDKNWIWKRLQADLTTLGLRPRRAHDLRRTLISLAIADGADEAILRRGTHAAPKHVMGLYTSVEWETLCREVAKLQLTPRAGDEVRKMEAAERFNRKMARTKGPKILRVPPAERF